MKIKNIALLLLVSCVPFAMQAMEDTERMIGQFNEDIHKLTFNQFLENIKKGSMGQKTAKLLNIMFNADYKSSEYKDSFLLSICKDIMDPLRRLIDTGNHGKYMPYEVNEKIPHKPNVKYSEQKLLDTIEYIQEIIKDKYTRYFLRYVKEGRAVINN